MAKYPILDLHATENDGQIFVSVGDAGNSKCSGTLTLVIADVNNGLPQTLTRKITSLGYPLQDILFAETPKTGKVHPVIATLVLDSGETKVDDELIELCK